MLQSVRIAYVRQKDSLTCYFTNEQVQYYGLNKENDTVILKFSSMEIALNRKIINNEELDNTTLYLSEDVKKTMNIEADTVLQIKTDFAGKLEIGPLIGVFINQEKVEHLLGGNGITAYTHFHNTCRKLNGICCFFSIENIDWDRKLVNSLIRKKNGWTQHTFPLPEIIYDRNVEKNCREESMELRRRLMGFGKILNPMAKLAKWETIKTIEKNPRLLSFIPRTIQYKTYRDLEEWLGIYKSIYLKPDALSKGKGIFRISRENGEAYKAEYTAQKENHVMYFKSFNELEALMEQYLEKGGGYIIQQEINKAVFRGNAFDCRALFQKDFEGVWQLSGIAGRIAGEGSIITSPRSGGQVEDFEIMLKEVFNEDYKTLNGIYGNIVNLGREICLTLEKDFGVCVELGLDMAIDVNRQLWLIEANGKPLKISLKRLNDPELTLRCSALPIEFAVKMSGFVSGNTLEKGTASG